MKVALSSQGEDFNWTFKAPLVSNWDPPLSYCVPLPGLVHAVSSVMWSVAADVTAPPAGVSGPCYWATGRPLWS